MRSQIADALVYQTGGCARSFGVTIGKGQLPSFEHSFESTHDIGLETVSEPGLGDPGPPFQIVDQYVEFVAQIIFELVHVRGHDSGQQDPPEPGCRFGRQPQIAQRHPASGSDGPRMADLQLGQQHNRRR